MQALSRERAVLDFLDDLQALHLHGFLLTLGGQTLCEGYFAPYDADTPHRMYSVSKSCVSLAIGLLLRDGKLSLSDSIAQHFPGRATGEAKQALEKLTLRDMLRMATCYDHTQYSPARDADWTEPFFHGHPTHPSGTVFNYDTSSSQTLCALVEKLAGEDILSFLERRLFGPLGMAGEKRWLKDGVGASQGGTGLVMTLRDLSKLANFCMSDGRGLIDAAYLREATAKQIDTDERAALEERHGYGYQFWRMRRGFFLFGVGGQLGLCLPEEGLCLCTTGDLTLDSQGVQPVIDAFFRNLSGIGALASDAGDAKALTERVASLRCEPVCGGEGPGLLRIAMTDSPLDFDALTILPDALIFDVRGEERRLPYGDGRWVPGRFVAADVPCMASGGWRSPQRFALRCQLTGDNACALEVYVALKGEEAAVRTVGWLNELAPGWTGLTHGRAEKI